jgi:CRISPR-associated protein Cas6
MRMYSAEWEAIKEFEHVAKVKDVQFDLIGLELPEDHGHALHEEVARHLPWMRNVPEAGIHPMHGAPSGRNANLVINRRVKLVLRLPLERIADARALVGQDHRPRRGQDVVGAMKEKSLMPFATLYSHFVDVWHHG